MPGGPCSEIKEEAKPGDIRGRGHPAIPARAHISHIKSSAATAADPTQSPHIRADMAGIPKHPPGATPC
ncbi:hypothetical protein AVXHC19_02630 [Acidovorax sacchari]